RPRPRPGPGQGVAAGAVGVGDGDAELVRQLGTLAFSEVEPAGPAEAIQAVAWWNMLARLGLRPPLVAVHDLGLLLAQGRHSGDGQAHRLATPLPRTLLSALRVQYRALLSAVAGSDLVEALRATVPRDETIAVVLARVLSDVYLRWPGAPRRNLVDELPLVSPAYALYRPVGSPSGLDQPAASNPAPPLDPGWAVPFLQRLLENERAVLARLDQIDISALRLLGLFSVEGGLPDLVDLYQVIGAIGTADIVDFSLQLLPSLLETKRRRSVQRFSIDGYASVERRGSIDALLPSELAHDEEVFAQKALSDDLLYYARERAPDAGRRLNLLLVDASASMRGARQVFARGLALALCKKLSLLGGEVWLRFFDSRLHERLDVGRAPGRELPRLLSFRSERGRNYPRVFGDLAADVGRLRREEGRDIAVTFITHAECHIPVATVEQLAKDASLYGIFVLPSRTMNLEYLPLLHRHQIVTAETLARAASSRRRALEIVEDATAASSTTKAAAGSAAATMPPPVSRTGRGGSDADA
ncbi:MAG: hypothetical protein ABI560_00320, partial [Myxococcales bacterium]